MRAYDFLLRYSIAFFLISRTYSQSIASLPRCWQNCINQNGYSCSDSDMNCLCTLTSSTPFLPGLLICVSKSCPSSDESNFDPSVLITSLQRDCSANGKPVPSSILSDASLAAQTTGDVGVATRFYSETTTMVTNGVTDSAGNRHTVITPVVVEYPITSTSSRPPSSAAGIVSSTSTGVSTETSATETASSSSAAAPSASSAAVISTSIMDTDTSALSSSTSIPVTSSSNTDTPASTAIESSSSPSSSSSAAAATSTGSNGSPFNMQSTASQRLSSSVFLSLLAAIIAVRLFR